MPPNPSATLRWLLARYDESRAPALEAERIVYTQDRAELFQLAAPAADPDTPVAVRHRNARILRIAIARHELSRRVDRRTRDCLFEQWENRGGSLIGSGAGLPKTPERPPPA